MKLALFDLLDAPGRPVCPGLLLVPLDVHPEDEVPLLLGLEGAGDDAILSGRQSHPHVGFAAVLPGWRFSDTSVGQVWENKFARTDSNYNIVYRCARPMETVVARVSEKICLELLDVVLDTIHFEADLQRYDSSDD